MRDPRRPIREPPAPTAIAESCETTFSDRWQLLGAQEMTRGVNFAAPAPMDGIGSFPFHVDPMELEAELGAWTPYHRDNTGSTWAP